MYSGELPDVWSCSDQYSDDSYPEKEEKEEIARYVRHQYVQIISTYLVGVNKAKIITDSLTDNSAN